MRVRNWLLLFNSHMVELSIKKRAEHINQVMQNKALDDCDINWLSEIQCNDVITGALLNEM